MTNKNLKRIMIIGQKDCAEKVKTVISGNELKMEVVDFWECNPMKLSLAEIEEMTNSLPLELKDNKIDIVVFASNEKTAKNFGSDLIPNRIKKYDMEEFILRSKKENKYFFSKFFGGICGK